jgi:hypothetical protein
MYSSAKEYLALEQGCFVVLKINPSTTVDTLLDPTADLESSLMQTNMYVGVTDRVNVWPDDKSFVILLHASRFSHSDFLEKTQSRFHGTPFIDFSSSLHSRRWRRRSNVGPYLSNNRTPNVSRFASAFASASLEQLLFAHSQRLPCPRWQNIYENRDSPTTAGDANHTVESDLERYRLYAVEDSTRKRAQRLALEAQAESEADASNATGAKINSVDDRAVKGSPR